MKYFFRSAISTIFYVFGFFKKRRGAIILMYHRINDALPPSDLVVATAKFRQQMEYLAAHCEVVGLESLLTDERRKKKEEGRKKVVITFDDGYRDNYLNGYPVLKELGLPATIFLTTGMIGTDKKRSRYQDMPSPDMLSWAEAKEMMHSGMTFGPHTASHPHLSALSCKEQKKEIEESIVMLNTNLSREEISTSMFCYPYGDYNAQTLNILKGLGIKLAVTIKPGINNEQTNLLQLKRTEISGIDSMFDFKKKLCGAFDWMHEQIQKKKGIWIEDID